MLRPAVQVRNHTLAARDALRDPRHVLFGDVAVIAVVRLPRNAVGVEQKLDGAGHVGGVHLFAAARRGDGFSGGDVVHLRPSPAVPDSMIDGGSEVRLGSETADAADGGRYYQLGAPYGRAVVVALASASPLFTSPRAEVEPATTYLAALEQALAAQGGQVQSGWQYLDIVAGQ